MKLVKILTTLGYFKLGYEHVIDIEKVDDYYIVTRSKDSFNKGIHLIVRCKDVIEYYDYE